MRRFLFALFQTILALVAVALCDAIGGCAFEGGDVPSEETEDCEIFLNEDQISESRALREWSALDLADLGPATNQTLRAAFSYGPLLALLADSGGLAPMILSSPDQGEAGWAFSVLTLDGGGSLQVRDAVVSGDGILAVTSEGTGDLWHAQLGVSNPVAPATLYLWDATGIPNNTDMIATGRNPDAGPGEVFLVTDALGNIYRSRHPSEAFHLEYAMGGGPILGIAYIGQRSGGLPPVYLAVDAVGQASSPDGATWSFGFAHGVPDLVRHSLGGFNGGVTPGPWVIAGTVGNARPYRLVGGVWVEGETICTDMGPLTDARLFFNPGGTVTAILTDASQVRTYLQPPCNPRRWYRADLGSVLFTTSVAVTNRGAVPECGAGRLSIFSSGPGPAYNLSGVASTWNPDPW